MASLRRRLITGAALWSVGLFVAVTLVMVQMLERNSALPQLIHHVFGHGFVVGLLAAGAMILGLRAMRRGFSPVAQLRERLGDVHAGRASRLDGVYPAEVQPLVSDLNALLDARDQTIARAQAKAGDLAHGLKTPLAILAHEAGRARADGHADLAATLETEIERMRRQIDYHLAQARAAAADRTGHARASVAESVDGLLRTLARVHGRRPLSIDRDIDAHHVVRTDRQDLDEMLGNLLDNAFKWGTSRVRISSRADGGAIVIAIEDDGPGVPDDQRDAVLRRGVRADQAAPGSGLGLAIADELARLYGGSVVLERSTPGGLSVRLTLPSASGV